MPPKQADKDQGPLYSDRVRSFLNAFAREREDVRKQLVKDLPAYNLLLSIEAESFEDVALRLEAQNRGEDFRKEFPPTPRCPFCNNAAKVKKLQPNKYQCAACKKIFAANHNSISSGTKCNALTWAKLIQCLLLLYGQTRTCEYCGIHPNTYFALRNRIFYAMQIFMEDVYLYGNIETDITYTRSNYKGVNLQVFDYPENSLFFDTSFKPRLARDRGGSYSWNELNANSICIFTAIDDHGHVMARMAGIGKSTFRCLKEKIPTKKYLKEVPKSDPFKSYMREQVSAPTSTAGDLSLIISDKEGAIKKHAEHLGIAFESHVYRSNNVQRRLPKNYHNIQKVNMLHKKLKDFLRDAGYVSTKYLPGFLILFEFIENTGATEAAICRLLEILATPNLGQPSTFYEEMFTIPNYLEEWMEDKTALKKISYSRLLAFYLYDHVKHPELYPNIHITMAHIEKETEYTAPTIRKIYLELCNAGYREKILYYFGEPIAPQNETSRNASDVTVQEMAKRAPATFNPVVLLLYDEFSRIKTLPRSQRITLQQFLDIKNREFGTQYKRPNIIDKFNKIEESGIRPQMPDYNKEDTPENKISVAKSLAAVAEYDSIILSYREKGLLPPKNHIICAEIGEKLNISYDTVRHYLALGRKLKQEGKGK